MKLLLVLSQILITSNLAFASRVGNGGNLVQCPGSPSEFFDYWEMSRELAMTDALAISHVTGLQAKVDLAIAKWSRLDQARAAQVKIYAQDLIDHLETYLTDTSLTLVSDDHARLEPQAPCTKTQLAIQIANPLSMQKRYAINRSLWEDANTSDDAKAGLILHEAIYRLFIEKGHSDSDSARYLNYLLASGAIDQITPEVYQSLVSTLHFNEPTFQTSGTLVEIFIPATRTFIEVYTASLVFESESGRTFLRGARLARPFLFQNAQFRVGFPEETQFTFFSSGNIETYSIPQKFFQSPTFFFTNQNFQVAGDFSFYPNGSVQRLTIEAVLPFVAHNILQFSCETGQYEFFPNGKIKSCFGFGIAQLYQNNLVPVRGPVNFDEDGYLVSAQPVNAESSITAVVSNCEKSIQLTRRNGMFTIDRLGKLVGPQNLSQAIVLTFHNQSSRTFFARAGECSLFAKGTFQVPTLKNGKYLLARNSLEDFGPAKQICQQAGLDDAVPFSEYLPQLFPGTFEKTLTQTETFYDPIANQDVQVLAGHKVYLYKAEITCKKEFQIAL